MAEKVLFEKPAALCDTATHYCPGCGHGIVHKFLAQAIDTLGIQDRTILIAPVGCAVFAYNYIAVDGLETPHGRAHAVATGIKRALPDRIVVSYQGDGDLIAIGTAETVHAANRGEHISVIFINNAIYGMTGGQMAPTSLPGQVTKTSPKGRDPDSLGYPIRACELLNTLEAPYYIERCSLSSVPNLKKAQKAVEKALRYQKEGRGYSFVEILAMCPTNWDMSAVESVAWIKEKMEKFFPPGVFRDRGEEEDKKDGKTAEKKKEKKEAAR